MYKELLIWLGIDEEAYGIQRISLVENPAIEKNFTKLNKQYKFSKDDESHIIWGPVIICDQPIYRNDDGEYYIVFSKESVEKIASKLIANGSAINVDKNHNEQNISKGIYPISIWIKNSKIATEKNYEDLPDGSLFIAYRVDKELFDSLGDEFNGFSLDGIFTIEKKESLDMDEVQRMYNKIKRIR